MCIVALAARPVGTGDESLPGPLYLESEHNLTKAVVAGNWPSYPSTRPCRLQNVGLVEVDCVTEKSWRIVSIQFYILQYYFLVIRKSSTV